DGGVFHHDNRRFIRTICIGCAETDEIVTSDQQRCRSTHCLDIKRLFHPPHRLFRERLLACGDLIDIATGDCVAARMKVPRSAIDLQDTDVRWKQMVEALKKNRRRLTNLPRHFEVCDLAERMNASVRSTSALQFDLRMEDGGCRLSHLPHDCARVLLLL